MRAVVYRGPRCVAVEDVPEPAIADASDAIVDVELAGVCGSDLHIYHGEMPGVLDGGVLGHEFVGRVREVGSGVAAVAPGDRVVGSFQMPCGACNACARRVFHACRDLVVPGFGVAFGDLPGAQAERVRVPRADAALRRIPRGVGAEDALLAGDVMSAAFTGIRPHVHRGDVVAVVGAGPVGLMSLEVARALGASRTVAVEPDKRRLAVAAGRGHEILDPAAEDPVSALAESTGGWGADLVVEAVGGKGRALDTAFRLAAPGARVVSLGVPTEHEFAYPWLEGFTKGLTFHATLANVPAVIDDVLAMIADGRLAGAWCVTHRMPLAEAPEAYRLFDAREATKVVLKP